MAAGGAREQTFSAVMRSPISNVGYIEREGITRGSAINVRIKSEMPSATATVITSSLLILSLSKKLPSPSPLPLLLSLLPSSLLLLLLLLSSSLLLSSVLADVELPLLLLLHRLEPLLGGPEVPGQGFPCRRWVPRRGGRQGGCRRLQGSGGV